MAAVEQYESESYTEDVIADTMVLINRDTLGASGQAKYDELAAAIFPAACQTKYETGVAALNAANYEGAIENLSKVVQMDANYDTGGALLNLGLAYMRSGDSATATTYLQQCYEQFADSEYAAEAKTNLDAIAQAAVEGAAAPEQPAQ